MPIDRRDRAAILGALLGSLVAFNAAAEAPGPATLLFLGNQNIAPVVYLEGGKPVGVAVDIVRALARHIPEPIEIRAMDWAQAQAMVARGDAAALIQINPTEERKKTFDFSDPLLESQFSIFVPTSRTGILGISSLRGLRVGVEEAGLPRQTLVADPDIHLTVIANFADGFKLLSDGALDAVVVDYRVGSYLLSVNRIANIKAAGEPIAFSYSAIAVRKGDAKLLGEINSALHTIRADGVYQSVVDKWKPTEAIFETREQIERRNYQAAIAVLAVGLAIAALWAATLNRNIARRRRVEEQLRRVNRARRTIAMCGQALVHAHDETALVQQVCQIIVEQAGHRLAWVGYAEQDADKTVRPVAQAGFNQGYVEMANVTWADSERGHGPTGTCIRTGETQIVNNIGADPRKAPWREEAGRRGYASSVAIPLMAAGAPLGALSIYSAESGAFGDEEVGLLTEFAEDLGYGIASLRAQVERKQAEKQVEHLAYYDPLTQLPNRRLFLDRLQQALAGCARSGRKGALLFVDLDNFKVLNETAGHDVGDQLLVEVARRVGNCVRNGDTVARLGGDEFVVLLEEFSGARREAAAEATKSAKGSCRRSPSPTPSLGGCITAPRASASRCSSTPSIRSTSCSSRPTSRCTKRNRRAATRCAFSIPRCRAHSPLARCSNPRCGSPFWIASSFSIFNRRSTTPAKSSAPRRCCAGATPSAAWLRPARSSRWPRKPD